MDPNQPPAPSPLTPSATPPVSVVKHGHRFISLYLTFAAMAVLIGGVYTWQHQAVADKDRQISDLNSQISVLNGQVSTLTAIKSSSDNKNSPLAYAKWRTYCDGINNACFRYPQDWDISGSSAPKSTTETVSSSDDSAVGQYLNPHQADATEKVTYIVSQDKLNTTSLDLTIVGRVVGTVPNYVLVDSSYVKANKVTAGKSVSFVDDTSFKGKNATDTSQFVAGPSDQVLAGIKDTDGAIAWFKTDDAKTCLQILKSFYYQ